MLSVLQGQQVAADAGFATPSEEVQQSELMEVLKKWLILSSVGILDAIEKCATLVVDVTKDEFDSDKADETRESLVGFGIALIANLLDNKLIEFESSLTISDEHSAKFLQDFIRSVVEDIDE